MTTRRVSVALCTHNGAAYLDAQLYSLAAQSRLPDELVICDDASTDDTLAVVRRFARQAPFPVQVHENPQPLGVTGNFSRALTACTGDILMPCDQDDVWHPEKIAAQTEAFADNVNLVFSDLHLVNEQGRPTGRTQWQALGFGSSLQAAFATHPWRVLSRFNVVTGTAMAFSAHCLPQVLPVPHGFIHDEWIAFIAAATGQVRLIDRPLVQYRQHAAQRIGAAPGNLWAQLSHARQHMGPAYFRTLIDRTQILIEGLERCRQHLISDEILPMLRERLNHQHRRVALREGHHARLPTVLREWTRGHYHRFGYGWKSAAQDLLL